MIFEIVFDAEVGKGHKKGKRKGLLVTEACPAELRKFQTGKVDVEWYSENLAEDHRLYLPIAWD